MLKYFALNLLEFKQIDTRSNPIKLISKIQQNQRFKAVPKLIEENNLENNSVDRMNDKQFEHYQRVKQSSNIFTLLFPVCDLKRKINQKSSKFYRCKSMKDKTKFDEYKKSIHIFDRIGSELEKEIRNEFERLLRIDEKSKAASESTKMNLNLVTVLEDINFDELFFILFNLVSSIQD